MISSSQGYYHERMGKVLFFSLLLLQVFSASIDECYKVDVFFNSLTLLTPFMESLYIGRQDSGHFSPKLIRENTCELF